MTPGQIFGQISKAPDTAAAVAALPLEDWRALFGYLTQNYDINGITGLVLGVMYVDAGQRLYRGGETL